MLEDIAYLERAPIKVKILKLLEKPSTPTRISKELKIHRASVSRILLELVNKGFVKVLNPKDRMARFYQISEKGKKVLYSFLKI
ncbi:MAG: helix-turn-helix domain-containing protein [Candidatus Woesearchaeota archaeon]